MASALSEFYVLLRGKAVFAQANGSLVVRPFEVMTAEEIQSAKGVWASLSDAEKASRNATWQGYVSDPFLALVFVFFFVLSSHTLFLARLSLRLASFMLLLLWLWLL